MRYKGHKLIKIFDRDKHIRTNKDGLVTGIRFIYKSENLEPCETCGEQTTRVIDYLGKLETQCKATCGLNI